MVSCREERQERVWKLRALVGPSGPFAAIYPQYIGFMWNVDAQSASGDINEEELSISATDDQVSCAISAGKRRLLDTVGWRPFPSTSRPAVDGTILDAEFVHQCQSLRCSRI